MTARTECCIPFCRRWRRDGYEPDEEWICWPHYKAIPLALRREYEAAWKEATAADERGDTTPAIFARVTEAFKACKRSAIEHSAGLI